MSESLTPGPRPEGDTQRADPATPCGAPQGGAFEPCPLGRPGHGGPGYSAGSPLEYGEGRIVTFTDVTDPRAAGQHATVRTLADEAGNRYVLLTTAQYLRLLMPKVMPAPAEPVSGFEVNDHGNP